MANIVNLSRPVKPCQSDRHITRYLVRVDGQRAIVPATHAQMLRLLPEIMNRCERHRGA